MKRNPSALADQEFDLIVVGGGIFGICAAWDAALRGLSVALIEQGDFGHATSAHHFKVIHGGIRYLQHADVLRVRESSADRSAFLRIAPHLVYPLPFMIPTYGHGMAGREAMTAALIAYDWCTFDRNRGIPDPSRQIPRGHTISRRDALNMFPQLDDNGLTGGAIFHDGQMHNPPRLSLSFVHSAVEKGAVAVNYAEVVQFLRKGDRVTGVAVHDRLTGDEFEVRGSVVLNATGPWAKWLLSGDQDLDMAQKPNFSRDAYFIVNRKPQSNHALAFQGQTKDPDAVLSRGNRHLFMVPWHGYTMFGVWHKVFKGRPTEFTVTEEDVQAFIDEVNASYEGIDLKIDEVARWNAGLTLFGENADDAEDLSYGKRSILLDHAKEDRVEGIISLIGVRFTTALGLAEQAVDLTFEKLGKTGPESTIETAPIYGGDFSYFDTLTNKAVNSRPRSMNPDVVPPLVHNHGSQYGKVLDLAAENEEWARPIGDTNVVGAEVIHAVRNEMAEKLDDIVFRRTDLATGGFPGRAALQTCANLMATELGWDEARTQQEVESATASFPFVKSGGNNGAVNGAVNGTANGH